VDIYALLIIANYICAKATPPTMPQLYGTLASAGVEVSGLARVAFYMDDPEVISDTELLLSNQTPIAFDNTPAGSADEFWAYDAASGGNRWLKIPLSGGAITLVDGGNKTFPAQGLTHTIEALAA